MYIHVLSSLPTSSHFSELQAGKFNAWYFFLPRILLFLKLDTKTFFSTNLNITPSITTVLISNFFILSVVLSLLSLFLQCYGKNLVLKPLIIVWRWSQWRICHFGHLDGRWMRIRRWFIICLEVHGLKVPWTSVLTCEYNAKQFWYFGLYAFDFASPSYSSDVNSFRNSMIAQIK